MPKQIDVSIIVPLFNEEESLSELSEWVSSVMAQNGHSYEVIMIDDGSTDDSWNQIVAISAKNPVVKGLKLNRNYGKSTALNTGFKAAIGDVIITMDADLQDSPDEIPGLVDMINNEGYDLVSGWKKKRHDPLSKTLPSKVFNFVTSIVSGIRLHDFNCGLKIYRHEVTEDALPYLYGELYRFLPAIAHWAGYRVGERPVTHHARQYGVSKFGAKRLLNGFLDLLSITFVVRFMTTPMHIFGTLGLLSTMAGGGIGAYISWLWWQSGTIQNRHPLMMLGVLLIIVGIQFFSTGLLGDMLASMHQRGGRTPRITSRLR